MANPQLDDGARRLIDETRRAVLTTIDRADGRPRSVPVCFVAVRDPAGHLVLYSPLDEKPKSGAGPRTLGRVRNLSADPRATLLVDRWDEDWSRLAWLRLDVVGRLVEPGDDGHATALTALREKYAQYRDHDLEHRPVLGFEVLGAVFWESRVALGRGPGDEPDPKDHAGGPKA